MSWIGFVADDSRNGRAKCSGWLGKALSACCITVLELRSVQMKHLLAVHCRVREVCFLSISSSEHFKVVYLVRSVSDRASVIPSPISTITAPTPRDPTAGPFPPPRPRHTTLYYLPSLAFIPKVFLFTSVLLHLIWRRNHTPALGSILLPEELVSTPTLVTPHFSIPDSHLDLHETYRVIACDSALEPRPWALRRQQPFCYGLFFHALCVMPSSLYHIANSGLTHGSPYLTRYHTFTHCIIVFGFSCPSLVVLWQV